MIYITNAFSINMLSRACTCNVRFTKLSQFEIRNYVQVRQVKSAIGHADTARIISNDLKINLEVNRANINLLPHESIIVAQYTGPRLAEGATTLPDNATLTYWLVTNLD